MEPGAGGNSADSAQMEETELPQQDLNLECSRRGSTIRTLAYTVVLGLSTARLAHASPWERAVEVLMLAFTGPIARGLSLVAVVIGGLMFAFGEGDSKRMLAGIVFGVGMAIGAVSFMGWLFSV